MSLSRPALDQPESGSIAAASRDRRKVTGTGGAEGGAVMLSPGAAETIGSTGRDCIRLVTAQSLATLNPVSAASPTAGDPATAASPTAGETLRAGRCADTTQEALHYSEKWVRLAKKKFLDQKGRDREK